MKKIILLIVLALNSLAALAGTIQIAKVTNDSDKDVTVLYALTNSSNELTGLQQKVFTAGKVAFDKKFTLDNLKKGITVSERDGHKIVNILTLSRFEPIYGGPLKLDYLVNGITGKRSMEMMDFVLEGDDWVLKKNNKIIKQLQVKTNTVMGKAVGIEEIKLL
jgi:hypothetical protein